MFIAQIGAFFYTERSHSGLVRRLGKAVYPQGYREFESLPLRQIRYIVALLK